MIEFRLVVSGFVLTVLHFCNVGLDVLVYSYVAVVHIAIDNISACDIIVVVVVADVLCVEGVRSYLHERPTSFTDGGQTLSFWEL